MARRRLALRPTTLLATGVAAALNSVLRTFLQEPSLLLLVLVTQDPLLVARGSFSLRGRNTPLVGDVSQIANLIHESIERKPVSAPTSPKNIVVVEDVEEIADILREALNSEPEYRAVVAYDGALALPIIRSVKASLVVLDVMLPGLDGFELYDALRQDPDTRDIPVVFVTAYYRDPRFQERQIPAESVFPKPFDLAALLARVAQLCDLDSPA